MKTTDIETHISSAISRAYVPTVKESMQVRLLQHYMLTGLNSAVLGRSDITQLVSNLDTTRLDDFVEALLGRPATSIERAAVRNMLSEHDPSRQHLPYEADDGLNLSLIDQLDPQAGQSQLPLPPLQQERRASATSIASSGSKGKKRKVINNNPIPGTVTELNQC
jgi:hypothetical protein